MWRVLLNVNQNLMMKMMMMIPCIVTGQLPGSDKQNFELKIVNNFLPISFNICFGCSKEPSQRWFFLVPTTYVLVEK